MFTVIDVDKSGRIEAPELAKYLRSHEKKITVDQWGPGGAQMSPEEFTMLVDCCTTKIEAAGGVSVGRFYKLFEVALIEFRLRVFADREHRQLSEGEKRIIRNTITRSMPQAAAEAAAAVSPEKATVADTTRATAGSGMTEMTVVEKTRESEVFDPESDPVNANRRLTATMREPDSDPASTARL